MRPVRFEACLFDLDGTLVDSEVLWVQVIRDFLWARKLPVTEAEVMEWVYGHAWADIHRRISAHFPALDMGCAAMEQTLRPLFAALSDRADTRIPGSIALLKRLARRHPVAIVTGSPRHEAEIAIDQAGIRPFIRFMLTSEDYTPGKPDPAGFRLAAERLNIPPERCIVFEDSAAGVRAAKAAGMSCVALAQPERPPQNVEAADLVLTDLEHFDMAF